MTHPPPSEDELFAAERPVRSDFARSDYARERSYARRRLVTLVVLITALVGGAYALWGRGPSAPAEIPTIKSEGAYRQKPADPGGIDIPHQDVRVYDQLESKYSVTPPVEHLLPPPETPKDVPHAAVTAEPPPAPSSPQVPVSTVQKTVNAAEPVLVEHVARPVETTVEIVPAPAPLAPASVVAPPPPPAPVATVAPAVPTPPPVSAPAPAAPKTEAVSIEQVIAKTKAAVTPASSPPLSSPSSSPVFSVQLASVNDPDKARAEMQELQKKYASILGNSVLRLERADLGTRGIYYRIQSPGLAESAARQICSSLKAMNAGCILVRK